MTCIVGLEHNGSIILGGDSAGVEGTDTYHRSIRSQPKVFRNGEFVMGYTSSFRMGQLLQYALKPPKQKPKQDDMQFLVVDFLDAVIRVYEEKGYLSELTTDDSTGEFVGGIFLFGYRGKLYTVDVDFQIGHSVDGYAAIGSGGTVAMGSLHTTEQLINNGFKVEPMERLTIALDAAVRFNAGVAAPYSFITLDKP